MDTVDIALRLSAASIVGVVLGLNRDLHGKPTGVRTLGVLFLGSALAVLSIHAVMGSDASRVIQGVVTGAPRVLSGLSSINSVARAGTEKVQQIADCDEASVLQGQAADS